MSNLTRIQNIGYGGGEDHIVMPVTAAGQLDPSPCGALTMIEIDINISIFSGSTSITFAWSRVDPNGVSYPVWTSTAQTGTGKIQADIGPGLTTTANPGASGFLSWTVIGTPSVTFTATVYGK